jgi:hypothetical protein
MADKDVAALRKRAQIAKANRLMFIWVAIASVIASASVVLTVVIVQRGLHNQRAITELNKTVSTLRSNNENVPKLEDSLRALSSNESLLKLRTTESDNALQVILDALPADPNPSALGASLQTKLFPADLTVESMQVTPINATGGGEVVADETAVANPALGNANPIAFQFVVSGSGSQLKTLLERLQLSIRTIQINRVLIESSGDKQTMTVEGEAYYQLASQLQLTNMDVKP